jgi:hypothetical protein
MVFFMASAAQLLSMVKENFDEKQFKFNVHPDDNVISIVFPVESKINRVNVNIRFHDDYYMVVALIPLNAGEDCRHNVAEYLTRANYGLIFGNFELDFADGDIRYRFALDCEGRESLSDNLILKTVSIPLSMIKKYGDGLAAVIFGAKSPEDAIKEAEGDGLSARFARD